MFDPRLLERKYLQIHKREIRRKRHSISFEISNTNVQFVFSSNPFRIQTKIVLVSFARRMRVKKTNIDNIIYTVVTESFGTAERSLWEIAVLTNSPLIQKSSYKNDFWNIYSVYLE